LHEAQSLTVAVRIKPRLGLYTSQAPKHRQGEVDRTALPISPPEPNGRVTLGRWQVLRASARVWAAPPGAATASGGCAASRRQWLTDETDSPLEQSGFELAVPGHVECIATVADWASRWVGDEETSIKETALSLSGQANGGANDLERVRRGSVSVSTEADPGQNRNK